MKYLYLPISLLFFTFTSCNQDEELKIQEGTVKNQSTNVSGNTSTLIQNLPSNELPIQAVNNNNLPNNPAPVENNVKLNPEHGQPGHRCEIAVGAPLNSNPPANNNTQTNSINLQPANNVNIQPTNNITTPAKQSNNTSSGALNPEHGKPGHRCDIAVGAPLNSKPPENTTLNNISTKEVISPMQTQPDLPELITPNPKPTTTTPTSNPNAKINPAHGEPGHKCEVAVGAPLPE